MKTLNLSSSYDSIFVVNVEKESEQNLNNCYQCGNCTAGCPCNFVYDIPVSRLMRLIQLGNRKDVLESESIWLCVSCESCTTRCPNNIDVARIMDVLRHMARHIERPALPHIRTFWDSFLHSIKNHGRVFELGLTFEYIAKTGRFWTDIDLGPKILPKGKLSLRPHRIKGHKHVARIFNRFEGGVRA